MKAYRLFIVGALFITLWLVLVIGCEYEVAEPLWDQPYTSPPTPKITQIDPAAANPGVNLITIHGENLYNSTDSTIVYFDNTKAEIVSLSTAVIMVRRPNIGVDSSTIKVVPQKAILEAKYSPYKVAQVIERYGSFRDNTSLSTITVDNTENVYVVETSNRRIHKVTPSGENTVIGTATRVPFDARIGPDGNFLILVENNRALDKVDLTTGQAKRWTQMPAGKVVKYGDFNANGYFYTGGNKTDLCIISPNPDSSLSASEIILANSYTAEEILAIQVSGGYVYVASRTGIEPAKIWRNAIAANGTVGVRELVFDMSTSADYSSRSLKTFSFTSNGLLFITTDSPNPILMVNLANSQIDTFYKGILRPYGKQSCWGNGNYLYLISGDTDAGEEWTVYRIDMGMNETP